MNAFESAISKLPNGTLKAAIVTGYRAICESAGTATGDIMPHLLKTVNDAFAAVGSQWNREDPPKIRIDSGWPRRIDIDFLGVPAFVQVEPDKDIVTFMVDAERVADMDSFGYQWHSLNFLNDETVYYNEGPYDGKVWDYPLGTNITLPRMLCRWFDSREDMPEAATTLADIADQADRERGVNRGAWENPELYADQDTYGASEY